MSTVTPAEVVTTLPAVPSRGGLVGAIAAVMNEVHVVAKRGENEFHRYRYATMGDILKEITPPPGARGGARRRPQGAERCTRVRRAAALARSQARRHCRAGHHEALRTGCTIGRAVAAIPGVGSGQSVLASLPRAGGCLRRAQSAAS